MNEFFFRYFKEGDAVTENGQIFRVLKDEAQLFLEKKSENGELKYKEVSFKDWLDRAVAEDTLKAMTEGCEDGTFFADVGAEEGPILCSLEDGEPVSLNTDEVDVV